MISGKTKRVLLLLQISADYSAIVAFFLVELTRAMFEHLSTKRVGTLYKCHM